MSICYGGVPGRAQTVPRAEMHGVLFALQHNRAEHLTIYVDPKWIVQGYIKGPRASKGKQNGDLWDQFWKAIRERGGSQKVSIRKVDAHKTVENVQKGEISFQDLMGNALADKGARLAADLSEVDSKFVDQVHQVDARTWIVQKRIVQAFRDKLNLDKNANCKAPAKPKAPKAPKVTLGRKMV